MHPQSSAVRCILALQTTEINHEISKVDMYSSKVPLQPRDDNIISDSRSTSSSNQFGDEAIPTQPESCFPCIRPVSYPKLPSRISPPKRKQTGPSSQRTWLRDVANVSPVTTFSANIGRRRANAVSLANSPARQGHSEEMARIFRQAQQPVPFNVGAKPKFVDEKSLSTSMSSRIRSISKESPLKESRVPQPSDFSSFNEPHFRTVPRLPPLTTPVRVVHSLPPNVKGNTKAAQSGRPETRPTTPNDSGIEITLNSTGPTCDRHEDAEDWTDDDKFLSPPASQAEVSATSIQEWLDGVVDFAAGDTTTLPDHSSQSSEQLVSPGAKQYRICASVSSIAERIRMKSPGSPSNQRAVTVPGNGMNEKWLQRGILATLLQPPCRTPRRSGSKVSEEKSDCRLPKASTRDRAGQTPQDLQDTKYYSSSSCEANSHASAPEIYLRKSEQPPSNVVQNGIPCRGGDVLLKEFTPEPRVPMEDSEIVDKLEIRELTPEVQKFRRGQGPKMTRSSSYYDKDIIQQRHG